MGVLPLLREVSLGLVTTVLARVPVGFESLGSKTGRGGGGGGAGILKPSSVAPPPPAAPKSLRLPVRDCVPMGGVGPAMVKSLYRFSSAPNGVGGSLYGTPFLTLNGLGVCGGKDGKLPLRSLSSLWG